VAACAPVSHLGAPSDQEASDYPCSYVLLLINGDVVVEHYEFKAILANYFVPIYLVQYGRDRYQSHEKRCLPLEPVGLILLDNAVEGAAEAGNPAIEEEVERGADRNQDTT
jgi:hypothetical protein